MSVNKDQALQRELHPVHVVLLAGIIPLFLGGLLSDLAYSSSYHIQWNNFASWLIAGALVFCGLALLWAVVDLIRTDPRSKCSLLYTLLLLATWILGFLNALTHARDAWASMPMGLILSVLVFVLACAATWVGLTKSRAGGGQ